MSHEVEIWSRYRDTILYEWRGEQIMAKQTEAARWASELSRIQLDIRNAAVALDTDSEGDYWKFQDGSRMTEEGTVIE
jgi:hypothetical protein